MRVKLLYIEHILVTVFVLAVHYIMFPFKWLYDNTDWGLIIDYKEYEKLMNSYRKEKGK